MFLFLVLLLLPFGLIILVVPFWFVIIMILFLFVVCLTKVIHLSISMKKFNWSESSLLGADYHSIKVRLVHLNQDQRDLCRAIGVTESCMSNWLSMATNMPYSARVAIEHYLAAQEVAAYGKVFGSDSLALVQAASYYPPIASEASSKQGLVSDIHPSELLG